MYQDGWKSLVLIKDKYLSVSAARMGIKTKLFGMFLLVNLASCASSNDVYMPNHTNQTKFSLVDRVQFLQNDQRWAQQTLGGSNENLKSDGCLVTASAMALVNLGFKTDPGDLTNRLKAQKGFTKNGWLIWSGLERTTGGRVKTIFAERADDEQVRSCLRDKAYPLVRFPLKSGSTHWAMVVGETQNGFYIRDPMVNSSTPIPLSSRAAKIEAVRCIGLKV